MTELQVDKKSNQPKQTITRRVVASSNRNKWTKGKAELPQRAPSEPTIVLPEPQSIQVAAQPSLPPQNLGFTLLSHTEVPEYLKEKFIYTGYRVNFTMRLCLHSLFRLHNETFNIWTHVIGAVLFISLIFLTAGYVQTDGLVHPSLLNVILPYFYIDNDLTYTTRLQAKNATASNNAHVHTHTDREREREREGTREREKVENL